MCLRNSAREFFSADGVSRDAGLTLGAVMTSVSIQKKSDVLEQIFLHVKGFDSSKYPKLH